MYAHAASVNEPLSRSSAISTYWLEGAARARLFELLNRVGAVDVLNVGLFTNVPGWAPVSSNAFPSNFQ